MPPNSEKKTLTKYLKRLPNKPGVYFFWNKKHLLYIGKATNLKNRVRSYFDKNIAEKRSEIIERMINESSKITFEQTDTVLESLLLEAELIRKFKPEYNTLGKDQKSFNFVVITDEEYPSIELVRERTLFLSTETDLKGKKPLHVFGPFPHGAQIREALKIIRRIFPYRDHKCTPAKNQKGLPRPCFNRQIGLCPGVCTAEITPKNYKRTIGHIGLLFQGKKKHLLKVMQKEMKTLAAKREFEEASKIKREFEALNHVNDIALLKRENTDQNISNRKNHFRIEAYDVAHTSGQDMLGVMVVIEKGETKQSDYRIFNIKGQTTVDDLKALRELLTRRFKHTEWTYPDLVVVDGNETQINSAKSVFAALNLEIPIVSVVKDRRHRARAILGGLIGEKYKSDILLANNEAHRFAITQHRKRRSKSFL